MRSPLLPGLVALAAAAALALPVTTVPAVAARPTGPPSSDDPSVTLLPPLPLRLGADKPCTEASARTVTGSSWERRVLGLPRAQQLTLGGGTTVAVVDTGVARVPSLSGRVTAVGGAGEDCVGHGTFAAGLLAGARTKDSGVVGIAPEAAILALRGTDDRGVPSAQLVAQGIRTAADQGVDVIYVGHAMRTGKAELTAAVAHAAERDAVVVAPAAPDAVPQEEIGADGEQPRGPYWPAAAPGVLAVVDYGPGGARQNKAPAAHEPDLSAPGTGVIAAGPRGSGHYIGSGSSLAAACTAGVVALVRAHHPGMSAEEVSRRLLETAYPSDTPRLDPYAALTLTPADGEAASVVPPAAHVPPPADATPWARALAIAGTGLALVLLVGAAAVVVPRGRARSWLPPGRPQSGPGSGL